MDSPSATSTSTPRVDLQDREVVRACGVCASTAQASYDPAGDIVECQTCGTLYVSPRPSDQAIAAFYSSVGHYAKWDREPGRAAMWRRRVQRLRRLVPSGRLLDVGAGQGDFGAIAKEYYEVEGTEISFDGIALARERHGLVLHQGHIEQLPLSPNRYDVVTLWHVLEHVPAPGVTLRRCYDLLAPGGLIAIAVPNADAGHRITRRNLRGAWRLLRGLPPDRAVSFPRLDLQCPDEEIHLTHFTMTTLRRALEHAGFEVGMTGIDDWSVDTDLRARLQHLRSSTLYRVTRFATAVAIFASARKPR